MKAVKIISIVLASLIAIVGIAVGILMYVVFTPAQLTSAVNKYAKELIICDYHLGQIDLTFVSTFPEFGLRADGLVLVNPTEGAPSDTLLEAKKVVARINLMELLNEGQINVHEVTLEEVSANPYIGLDGVTNFDILKTEEDTTESDSSSFIKGIKFEDLNVKLEAKQIAFVDERDSIHTTLHHADITLSAKEMENEQVAGTLDVELPNLTLAYKGVDYATQANIKLHAPYHLQMQLEGLSDLQAATVHLEDATLAVNEFTVDVEGQATVLPTIDTDLKLSTNQWHLSDFLAIVPAEVFTMPEDITADGDITLVATVKGEYNDSTMPLVDAHIELENATGAYAGLPYTLENVSGDVSAHVDLNNEVLSEARVNAFSAKIKNSSVTATGTVSDLLNSMLLDLVLDIDLNIPDAAYFFPEGLTATGRAKGPLKAKITLDDLSNLQLAKGTISSNLNITSLHAKLDDMKVDAKTADLAFNIPNQLAKKSHKTVNFLDGTLKLSNLQYEQDGSLKAQLGKTDIALQVSDILSDDEIIYADLGVKSARLDGTMSMKNDDGTTSKAVVKSDNPNISAYVEYDTKDNSGNLPAVTASFKMGNLDASLDTITAYLTAPEGTAAITSSQRGKVQPKLSAKIKAQDLEAEMGDETRVETSTISVAAAAQHTNNTENILLEWQPKLEVNLQKGVATVPGFEPIIKIPQIKFHYSNEDFLIDTSRIELGKSDFCLSGKVDNIGPFLKKEEDLKGVLNFTSNHTDVDELLGYVSGFGDEEEDEPAATTEATTETSNPFMVPKRVDLTLNTHIKDADAYGQHVRNLAGRVYIKNAVLVVEEMGFVCDAAKLQLTAMYKSPRKSNLFVGFDYHMTDINIKELVDMIPQVDEMFPMLRSFKGAANFHLAAETYMKSNYDLKPSTIRGAMSVDAKDLTLLDGETFTTIARLLTFKKQTENKIDSISAEAALYKNQIDIYPFLITCDKWMGAVGGKHNLDGDIDYNVNVLAPIYLGVHVGGTLDDLDIKLAKCVYAQDFRPLFHREVDTTAANIRKLIKQSLEKGTEQK